MTSIADKIYRNHVDLEALLIECGKGYRVDVPVPRRYYIHQQMNLKTILYTQDILYKMQNAVYKRCGEPYPFYHHRNSNIIDTVYEHCAHPVYISTFWSALVQDIASIAR